MPRRSASDFARISSTSTSATRAPSAWSRRAASRPIPRAPPVIKATFPPRCMPVIRPGYAAWISRGLDAVREVLQRADAVVVGVEVQLERIHQHRPQAGLARADDVDARHVADVPRVAGVDAHRVEREVEDPRVGLHHADRARVDHALHVDADAGTDLQDLELGEPLADQPVGVRDDAEPDARLRRARAPRRAQPGSSRSHSAASANSLSRCRCTSSRNSRRAYAARGDIAVEVRAPRRRPVEVVGHRELTRAEVVRTVEHLDRGSEARRANAATMRSCSGTRNTPPTSRSTASGLGIPETYRRPSGVAASTRLPGCTPRLPPNPWRY